MSYRRVRISTFGGPEVLEVVEEDEPPKPGPGEVRVRVLAAGASFTDTLIRAGKYPDLTEKPPLTPGYDLVGVVDLIGERVDHLSVGDRVADLTVTGAYSEYVCLPANGLVAIPPQVDPAEAVSLILSGMTAYQMLKRKADLKTGDKILIHGAGGAVGVPLMQIGQLMGLEMFATASPSKREVIEKYGATPIDYRSEDFVQSVRELTGDGVDAVFDGIDIANFNRSFRTLRKEGKLVIYGAVSMNMNSWLARFGALGGLIQLFVKSWLSPTRSIDGYSIASRRKKNPEEFKEDLAALFELLARGKLKPEVDRVMELEDVREAHELIERAAVRGRIVLKVAEY